MKTQLVTWALSVLAACMIGGAWIYTHPQPKLVRLDMKVLFADQKEQFAKLIKPDMTAQEQQAVIAAAKSYSQQLNQAIAQMAKECNCALLNSDAILEMPKDPKSVGIPDVTERVRQMIAAAGK